MFTLLNSINIEHFMNVYKHYKTLDWPITWVVSNVLHEDQIAFRIRRNIKTLQRPRRQQWYAKQYGIEGNGVSVDLDITEQCSRQRPFSSVCVCVWIPGRLKSLCWKVVGEAWDMNFSTPLASERPVPWEILVHVITVRSFQLRSLSVFTS